MYYYRVSILLQDIREFKTADCVEWRERKKPNKRLIRKEKEKQLNFNDDKILVTLSTW